MTCPHDCFGRRCATSWRWGHRLAASTRHAGGLVRRHTERGRTLGRGIARVELRAVSSAAGRDGSNDDARASARMVADVEGRLAGAARRRCRRRGVVDQCPEDDAARAIRSAAGVRGSRLGDVCAGACTAAARVFSTARAADGLCRSPCPVQGCRHAAAPGRGRRGTRWPQRARRSPLRRRRWRTPRRTAHAMRQPRRRPRQRRLSPKRLRSPPHGHQRRPRSLKRPHARWPTSPRPSRALTRWPRWNWRARRSRHQIRTSAGDS